MTEVAILLISISIFIQWSGLIYVLFTMYRNQKRSATLLKELGEKYTDLTNAAHRAAEEALVSQQRTAGVPVANNFWGVKN